MRALIFLAACSGGGHVEPPVGSAQPPPVGSAQPPPVAREAPLAIPSSGPFTVPASFTRCTYDVDCIVVASGCCDDTPVNLAHVEETKRALERSGRPYCSPKTACGPGRRGTWEDEWGACVGGSCAMPPDMNGEPLVIPASGPFALPPDYATCASDADCVVVSLGCADETPVNRTHAARTLRALTASGRGWRPPKDACGPGLDGTWNRQPGACTAGSCTIPKWPPYR